LAYFGDKPVTPPDLPNPELNPLLNPKLGQNLGRWAQVYFTNPPEKRDQAVIELLRELEAESSPGETEARMPQLHPNGNPVPHQSAFLRAPVMCRQCHEKNEVGQKFCGMCGALLDTANGKMRVERPEPAASSPRTQQKPASRDDNDIDWLRGSAIATYDEPEQTASGWAKYAVFGLLLLLGAFGYLEWVSRTPPKTVVVTQSGSSNGASSATTTSTSASQPVETAPSTKPLEPAASANESQSATDSKSPKAADSESQTSAPEPPAADPTATENPSRPLGAAQNARHERVIPRSGHAEPTGISSVRGAESANGALELQQAQNYLQPNGAHNGTEAARLLWKAVGKENMSATLLLADMYMRGDGVSQSCDQARLLLVAATKKGSSEAAAKLRGLESGGCR